MNEAMIFGLPVVVSDQVGCAADLVRQGENGYVVRHDSPAELTEALQALVTDPARRRSFGQQSAAMIAGWNYEAAAAGLSEAVRQSVSWARWQEAEKRGVRSAGALATSPRS